MSGVRHFTSPGSSAPVLGAHWLGVFWGMGWNDMWDPQSFSDRSRCQFAYLKELDSASDVLTFPAPAFFSFFLFPFASWRYWALSSLPGCYWGMSQFYTASRTFLKLIYLHGDKFLALFAVVPHLCGTHCGWACLWIILIFLSLLLIHHFPFVWQDSHETHKLFNTSGIFVKSSFRLKRVLMFI